MIPLEIIIKTDDKEIFEHCNNELILNGFNYSNVPFNESSYERFPIIAYNKKIEKDEKTGIEFNYRVYIHNPKYHKKVTDYGDSVLVIAVGNQDIRRFSENITQIKDKELFYSCFSDFVSNYIKSNTKCISAEFRSTSSKIEEFFFKQNLFLKSNFKTVKSEIRRDAQGNFFTYFYVEAYFFKPQEEVIISGLDYYNF